MESTLNSQLKFDILALYDDKPGIKMVKPIYKSPGLSGADSR
ncbi:MAG: hypothetical protein R3C24_07155 [Cyanobacteriota/Melainabacteria group bacterium]